MSRVPHWLFCQPKLSVQDSNSTKTINCLGLNNYGKIGNFADLVNLLIIGMKRLLWLALELHARPQGVTSI